MIHRYWNSFLLFLFLLIAILVGIITSSLKKEWITNQQHKDYANTVTSLNQKISTLIEEKQNATLTIALSLSQNSDLQNALIQKENFQLSLKEFSAKLNRDTDFKNVWIQLVDRDGISLARSWSDKKGDNLANIRADVRRMIASPRVQSSVSVGHFDMTFKAMVPIYDKNHRFIGYLEVLSHFNSVAKKIQDEGVEPIILVDKKYKKELISPFTALFVKNNYVANQNANPILLKYIAKKGIDYFINPIDNYTIDKEGNYFVINYPLYDIDNNQMAIFLLFKPLASFDTTTIENTKIIINLSSIFIVVVAGFILFILSQPNKMSNSYTKTIARYTFLFITFFITASTFFYLLMQSKEKKMKAEYIQEYQKNITQEYTIVTNSYLKFSEIIFKTLINRPSVLEIMEKSYHNNRTKTHARQALLNALKNDYDFLKTYQIRQLHFQLKNNESFLRFHRPDQFGDDLTGIRPCVEWVNKYHTRIDGFEEGRIYNGFRHVFPLISTSNTHLGSVEISYSAYAIISELTKNNDLKASFLIHKHAVDSQVFKKEQTNYTPSEFSDFYYEIQINRQLKQSSLNFEIQGIDPNKIRLINKQIFKGTIFTIPSQDEFTLYTFIPLINPITKNVVGSIVLQQPYPMLKTHHYNFLFFILMGFASILFMTLFIYRETIAKLKFKALSERTQRILDSQRSIVLITNGAMILDANQTFLDFFGFTTLHQYGEHHHCICDHFVKDDHYFHLDKITTNATWIETLLSLPEKERIVMMLDKEGVAHSFHVSLNQFTPTETVATFTDISETLNEQYHLTQKVTHDKLTQAYNREFFESTIKTILEGVYIRQKQLALLMLDIDHFKLVNDTYGHNCGDTVLREISALVHSSLRSDDYLIRWGGEEFIILLTVSSLEEALKISEHCRQRIEQTLFDEVGRVTCSFGVTLHCDDEPIKQTIQRADKALYSAKKSGRNQVVAS